MKKLIFAALLTAAFVIAAPKSAKADAALNYANNFNNMQYNYLNAQNSYYNTYQVPVMNVYDQAMSNQISQALAAQYQAQIMRQQALARNSVNIFQVTNNMAADMTNYGTQLFTMGSNGAYNMGMNSVAATQAALQFSANVWGAWTGQPPFPQVP